MVQAATLRRRRITPMFLTIFLTLLVGTAALAAAIAWGGPPHVSPLASINDPFKGVDSRDVPPAQHYTARDGTSLAWHSYRPAGTVLDAPQRRVCWCMGRPRAGSRTIRWRRLWPQKAMPWPPWT